MNVRLPGQAKSQSEIAYEMVRKSIRKYGSISADQHYYYGMASFSGPDQFKIDVPFSASGEAVLNTLPGIEYWGTTCLDSGLMEAASYLKRETQGKTGATGRIVLISDGINTDPELYGLPEWDGRMELDVLKVPLPFNSPAEERWAQWCTGYGENSRAPEEPLLSTFTVMRENQLPLLLRSVPADKRRPVSLQLLVSLIIAAGLFFLVICRLLTGKEKKQPVIYRTAYRIHYRKRTSQSIKEEMQEYLPEDDSSIVFRAGGMHLKIRVDGERRELRSNRRIMIDGVLSEKRKIHDGSTIMVKGVHYTIRRIEKVSLPLEDAAPPLWARNAGVRKNGERAQGPELRNNLNDYILLPFSAALVIWLVLTGGMILLTGSRRYTPREVSGNLTYRPYRWEWDFVSAGDNAAVWPSGEPKIIEGVPEQDGWQFSGLPEAGTIDVLGFHSHPDDESLDFGGFLAKSDMEGKTTAVVLFTDGESGLSRGPSAYLSEKSGLSLKQTRIEEAHTAMGVLGVDYYIRLGFQNHPYSSQLQVLPMEDVYRDWGGYGQVKSAVIELLNQIEPRTVIAPDGPSTAFEHFEHAAAGQAVKDAISEQGRKGGYVPEVYRISVDPLQLSEYPAARGIDVLNPPSPVLPSPRKVQNGALKAHRSQIDARIIGLEYTSLFQYEYYMDGMP